MPLYEFACPCGNEVAEMHPVGRAPTLARKCEACGKKRLVRLFGVPNVKTTKTLKTFGQQSEANIKEIGREGMEYLERDYQRSRYEAREKFMEEAALEMGAKPIKLPKKFKDNGKDDPKLVKEVKKKMRKKDQE